jgi:hypothetical protein
MLADRHNKDTLRVDPEQALLANDCNMSRSTINRHLEDLERTGLLVRVPRANPKTQKQIPTFYVLAIDFANPPHIEFAVSDYETRIAEVQNRNIVGSRVLNSDTGAVSQKSRIPCPKNRDSRVSKSDTNHVKEPVKEPCAAEAAPRKNDLPENFFDRFFAVYPRTGDREKTEAALRKAVCQDGVSGDAILSGAKAYAAEQKGNQSRYIAYSENWVKQKRWVQFGTAKKSVNPDVILERRAQLIREGSAWIGHRVSAAEARDMVSRGLVTVEQCRAARVDL